MPDTARRVRDPQAKRAAILAAARQVFAERGYTGATIRAIAERAGVGHGLVMMHFHSKEQLFLAAVPGTRDVEDHVVDDVAALPHQIARNFVERMESADPTDPFVALVRSAGTDQRATERLLLAMHDHSVEAYRKVPGLADLDDLEERVAVLGAHMIGVTVARYILGDGPLSTMDREEFVRRLEATTRAILLG